MLRKVGVQRRRPSRVQLAFLGLFRPIKGAAKTRDGSPCGLTFTLRQGYAAPQENVAAPVCCAAIQICQERRPPVRTSRLPTESKKDAMLWTKPLPRVRFASSSSQRGL